MSNKSLPFAVAIFLLFAGALSAQSGAGSPGSSSTPTGRQEPCWKQAGITRAVMDQHQQIEHDAHSQIAGVCEDSSLTPHQKQEKVRAIRQQTEEKIGALITSEQMSTLHACQQQRRGGSGGNMGRHAGTNQAGGNPCGNIGASQGRQGSANGNTGGSPQPPQN